jgi:hypothetical protein
MVAMVIAWTERQASMRKGECEREGNESASVLPVC